MVGEIQKPLIVVADQDFYDLVEVPFARIVLGDQLTRLSIATHAHETAHSQTEDCFQTILAFQTAWRP